MISQQGVAAYSHFGIEFYQKQWVSQTLQQLISQLFVFSSEIKLNPSELMMAAKFTVNLEEWKFTLKCNWTYENAVAKRN